ncbi:MAG: type IV pilus assembly protein PilM [Candidatus Omnitrophica bacterium]|nr:type IV pilus assembly protein PilM [Candidatus Omnitrophota bacterium]
MKNSSRKNKIIHREKIYGVDIGKSGVKIALLFKNQEKNIMLENLTYQDFPIYIDSLKNTTVVQTIREAISKLEVETERIKAVVNLYGTEPVIKFLTLPHMPEDELNKTIRWQAQKHIIYDLEKMIIDYAILNTFEEMGVKKISLVLAATMKETIINQLEILKEANIEPVAIDVDCLAQFYLAREKGILNTTDSVCILDIGAKNAVIQIIDNGIPRFRRECINIGASEINKAIKETLKVSWEDAEKIKREFSLSSLEMENNGEDKVKGIIKKVIEDAIIEIKRSLDYYIDISPQKSVECIFLTGGGALLGHLDLYLKQQLGIKVEKLDPFKDVVFSEKIKDIKYAQNNSLRFVTAMGLALEAIL